MVTEAHARGKKVAMHGQTDAEVRLGLQKWAAQRRLLFVEARDHRRPREQQIRGGGRRSAAPHRRASGSESHRAARTPFQMRKGR